MPYLGVWVLICKTLMEKCGEDKIRKSAWNSAQFTRCDFVYYILVKIYSFFKVLMCLGHGLRSLALLNQPHENFLTKCDFVYYILVKFYSFFKVLMCLGHGLRSLALLNQLGENFLTTDEIIQDVTRWIIHKAKKIKKNLKILERENERCIPQKN
jgi:hypothetical protein